MVQTHIQMLLVLLTFVFAVGKNGLPAQAQLPIYPFDPYPLSPPWEAQVENTDMRVYHKEKEVASSAVYNSNYHEAWHPMGLAGFIEVRLYAGDGPLVAYVTVYSGATFTANFANIAESMPYVYSGQPIPTGGGETLYVYLASTKTYDLNCDGHYLAPDGDWYPFGHNFLQIPIMRDRYRDRYRSWEPGMPTPFPPI